MNRGWFRLSVVAAGVGASIGLYMVWAEHSSQMDQHGESVGRRSEINRALACGAKLSDEVLNATRNAFGNYNLYKVGCAPKEFIASAEEIAEAREGKAAFNGEDAPPKFEVGYALVSVGVSAALGALLVNALLLGFFGVRRTFRWVSEGFKT